MRKYDFVAKVRDASGMSHRQARFAVTAVIKAVHDTLLAGEELRWDGFGTFQLLLIKGRKVPPRTIKKNNGQEIPIPELNLQDRVRVRFVASTLFRNKLNSSVSPTQIRFRACAPSPNTSKPEV